MKRIILKNNPFIIFLGFKDDESSDYKNIVQQGKSLPGGDIYIKPLVFLLQGGLRAYSPPPSFWVRPYWRFHLHLILFDLRSLIRQKKWCVLSSSFATLSHQLVNPYLKVRPKTGAWYDVSQMLEPPMNPGDERRFPGPTIIYCPRSVSTHSSPIFTVHCPELKSDNIIVEGVEGIPELPFWGLLSLCRF